MTVTPQPTHAELNEKIEVLSTKVDQLAADTKSLVDAWKAGTGLVTFIKGLSALVAALGVLWLFVTNIFRHGN